MAEKPTYEELEGRIETLKQQIAGFQTQAPLRESEKMFQLLAENIQDVFWISRPGDDRKLIGEQFYVSPGYERVWGRPLEELEESPVAFLEALHPEDRPVLEESLKERHQACKKYICEYRIIRPDGEVRWINERGFPVTDSESKETMMVGICSDITDAKRIEDQLKRTNAELITIFNTIPGIINIVDRDFNVLEVSRRFADAFSKLEGKKLIGQKCYQVYKKRDSICPECLVKRVYESGKLETRVSTSEEEKSTGCSLKVYASPIKNDEGNIIGAVEFGMDITDLKQAEEALRKSEELAKAALNATTDMVYLTDTNGNILVVNNTAAQNLGKTPDELIGKNIFDFFPPKLAKTRKEQGDKVTRSGRPLRFQDGREGRFFDNSIYPTFDAVGKVDRLTVFVTDITKSRQAEKALRESEERLRAMGDVLPDLAFILDEDGRYVEVLTAESNLLYKEVVQTKGRLMHEVLPKSKADLFLNAVRRTIDTHESQILEYELQVPAGPSWFEGRTALLNLRVKGKQAVVFIARDITDRKRAEEDLNRSEKNYRNLVDSSLVGIYQTNIKGQIQYVNNALVKMFEFDSSQEMMSQNVLVRYKNPKDRQRLIKILKKSGYVNNFEVELVTRKGNSRHTILSAILEGDTLSGMIMDITERKNAESTLVHREEALKTRTKELEEVNNALRVLLRQREEDKAQLEKKVLLNVKRLVVPYVERLKKSRLPKEGRAYLSKVESGLNEIASSFAHTLFSQYSDLTLVETQIADLIREGKTTKEIAELLNVSPRTIETHRKNIRTKMGIRSDRTNLRAHLLSLQ